MRTTHGLSTVQVRVWADAEDASGSVSKATKRETNRFMALGGKSEEGAHGGAQSNDGSVFRRLESLNIQRRAVPNRLARCGS
jgi:hypothetical protein